MEQLITASFIPVKIHVKEQPKTFERFGVQWTPTFVIFDPEGQERRRWEGFLPADDLLAQLELALGQVAFGQQRWEDARQHFQRVLDQWPGGSAAPEALYWVGVARYKAGDAEALPETAEAFTQRFQQTDWAKKASVWAH